MTSLPSALRRGMLAGAAGTTALNGLTYLDMALRGRPASDTPVKSVAALADRVNIDIPGRRRERENRLAGLGPLSGSLTGIGFGAVGGVARAAGLRLPAVLGGPLLGGAVMAVTDRSMAQLGVTDPRQWSAAAWWSDVLPHLGYGMVAHACLVATEKPVTDRQADAGTLTRSLAVGAATGGRSTAGLTALALTTRAGRRGGLLGRLARPGGKVIAVLATAAEMTLDKSSHAPSRLSRAGLPGRVLNGAASAAALARRNGTDPGPQAVAGMAGAVGGAFAGHWWRGVAQRWFGDDLPGALIEDGVVALLAVLACRRP